MKALHIITGLGVGGAEQQLRLLLRHLPLACDVVTLTNPGAVAEGLRADGVRVTHLGMSGNRDVTALPRLTRLIRRGRYDLVHTHLYRACVYGRIAAKLAGVRATVATEHSLGEAEIEGRPLTPGTRALYLGTERLGSATVAVSATVAARLRDWGVPAERIHVVPNGIDAASFRYDPELRRSTRTQLGIPADAFVVGGVGRLVPGKRFDVLVRAVAALPDAWLLLAGEGPEGPALRTLATRLGAAHRIRFLGECEAGEGASPDDAPAGRTGDACAGESGVSPPAARTRAAGIRGSGIRMATSTVPGSRTPDRGAPYSHTGVAPGPAAADGIRTGAAPDSSAVRSRTPDRATPVAPGPAAADGIRTGAAPDSSAVRSLTPDRATPVAPGPAAADGTRTDAARCSGCSDAAASAPSRSAPRSGIPRATRPHPPSPRIPALLSAMDAFVSTSREEAFGLAVVEALAAGLPVLHSACPAIDDLPAGQSPGARRIGSDAGELTAALQQQRQQMRTEGVVRRFSPPPVVSHYDIARSSERLMEVYAHALASTTTPSTKGACQ